MEGAVLIKWDNNYDYHRKIIAIIMINIVYSRFYINI